MPNVSINPPAGLFLNGTDYEAQGRWRLGNLVRFFRGSPQPVGGWTSLVLTVRDSGNDPAFIDTIDGVCRGLLTWRDNNEKRWMAIGTTQGLFVHDGSELFNVTPAGFTPGDTNTSHGAGFGAFLYDVDTYGTVRQQPITTIITEPGAWSFSTWGEELIASPNWDGKIYKWVPDAAIAVEITGDAGEVPQMNRAILVSNERHMIAIGAGDWGGAVFTKNLRRIAWSTSEDNEEWNPSLINSAGDLELNTKGIAMAAAKFRNEILIWTDIDMHRMAYIGAPFYYSLQKLSPAAGVLSIQAQVVTSQFAFWVGPQGFYIYDGAVRELIPDISDFYTDDVTRTETGKVCCGHNPNFNEVWTFYPSRNSLEIDSYVVWNYEDNTWAVGRLSRSSWNQASIWSNPLAASPIHILEADTTDQLQVNFLHGVWRKIAGTTQKLANIVVKNSAGTVTYSAGSDYELWTATGQIRTLVTGNISEGVDLLISYKQLDTFYSKIYNHEDGYTDEGADRSVWIETAPFEIGLGDNLAQVLRIVQDTGREDDLDPLLNSDAVTITFKTRLAPEAEAIICGPYTLDPMRGYTDVRFTGRQVSMRVDQVKSELWRLGKYRLEIVMGSGR